MRKTDGEYMPGNQRPLLTASMLMLGSCKLIGQGDALLALCQNGVKKLSKLQCKTVNTFLKACM